MQRLARRGDKILLIFIEGRPPQTRPSSDLQFPNVQKKEEQVVALLAADNFAGSDNKIPSEHQNFYSGNS